jgi:hypothetical protein
MELKSLASEGVANVTTALSRHFNIWQKFYYRLGCLQVQLRRVQMLDDQRRWRR